VYDATWLRVIVVVGGGRKRIGEFTDADLPALNQAAAPEPLHRPRPN
jgi:hypothetical protein